MKTFHYEHGVVAGQTMTVQELREALLDYPDDMPVFGLWEGCYGYIKREDFYVEEVHKSNKAEACDCLCFWVESY